MFTKLIAYSSAPVVVTPEPAAAAPGKVVSDPEETVELVPLPVPALPPPRALNADAALVARFMLECLPRCDGGEAMRGAVYKRFLRWCDEQSPPATAPNAPAFWAHFEPLCGRVGIRLLTKRGGKVYCIGVKLAA